MNIFDHLDMALAFAVGVAIGVGLTIFVRTL